VSDSGDKKTSRIDSFCFAYISFLLLKGSTLPTACTNYPKKAQNNKTI
jgi:hypothetical protein